MGKIRYSLLKTGVTSIDAPRLRVPNLISTQKCSVQKYRDDLVLMKKPWLEIAYGPCFLYIAASLMDPGLLGHTFL